MRSLIWITFTIFVLTIIAGFLVGLFILFVSNLWSNADPGNRLIAFVTIAIASLSAFVVWFNKRYIIDIHDLISIEGEDGKEISQKDFTAVKQKPHKRKSDK